MSLRAIETAGKTHSIIGLLIGKSFKNIIKATVSSAAVDLVDLGYPRDSDSITMNFDRLIGDAKKKVLALATNYRPRDPLEGLEASGKSVASALRRLQWDMNASGLVTEYEVELGGVIVAVITGENLLGGMPISEQYLLDLEREAFITPCRNPKTLERIEHMLKTSKGLRN